MATVYTVSMGKIQGATGAQVLGGPPVGYRWILTNVDFFVGNQVNDIECRLYDETTGAYFFADSSHSETQTWFQWSGRQVFDHPDRVIVEIDGGNADVSAAGFQLTLP